MQGGNYYWPACQDLRHWYVNQKQTFLFPYESYTVINRPQLCTCSLSARSFYLVKTMVTCHETSLEFHRVFQTTFLPYKIVFHCLNTLLNVNSHERKRRNIRWFIGLCTSLHTIYFTNCKPGKKRDILQKEPKPIKDHLGEDLKMLNSEKTSIISGDE